jgi:hypothetical protein
MDKIDVKTILHALNTFPKAFFIWGILDQRPQRPVEMEEKLREQYPEDLRINLLWEFKFPN